MKLCPPVPRDAYLAENSSNVSSSWPLLRTAQELKADFWAIDFGVARVGARKTERVQGRVKVEVLRAASRKKVVDAMSSCFAASQSEWRAEGKSCVGVV